MAIMMLGCSPSNTLVPPATDGAPCQTVGLREAQSLDPKARLAAAFVSNVADVASWESHGYGSGSIRLETSPSSYPGAPLDRVDVCYYDGAFKIGSRPFVPAGGTASPSFDLLLVTVNLAGQASVRTAGFRRTTPSRARHTGP